MLSHTIKKGNQTKRVTEFAWRRKYEAQGWAIVDTKGKATEAAQPPALPPTKFEPPAVVRLRAAPVVVENARPSDPIGTILPPYAEIPIDLSSVTRVGVLTETDTRVEEMEKDGALVVDVAPTPEPKKRGRPAKVKA